MKTFIEQIGASNEIIGELGKFSLLWAQFEFRFCDNHCSDKLFINNLEDNTRQQDFLNRCNLDLDYKSLSDNLISSLLNYFNESKDTISPEKIHKKLYSQDFKKPYKQVDDIICKDITDNKELLLGCLLIIFRLRNNMFHGLKDCYGIDQQIEVFKSCNNFLNFLLVN